MLLYKSKLLSSGLHAIIATLEGFWVQKSKRISKTKLQHEIKNNHVNNPLIHLISC